MTTRGRVVTERFRSTIEPARGPGATVALVPAAHVDGLGGVKQKRLLGKVNGVDFTTASFPYKGALYVGVPKATRVAAGVEVGDEADFELRVDPNPPDVEIAPELAAALAAEPGLRERFEALSRSRKRELADPVRDAKRPETRATRVRTAIERLRD